MRNENSLALVKPPHFVALFLERGHDHVGVVVTKPEHRLVRVDPRLGVQAAADLVQVGLGEGLLVLEEVVEDVEGAELARLPLVVDYVGFRHFA